MKKKKKGGGKKKRKLSLKKGKKRRKKRERERERSYRLVKLLQIAFMLLYIYLHTNGRTCVFTLRVYKIIKGKRKKREK